jgi:hypothetical protein
VGSGRSPGQPVPIRGTLRSTIWAHVRAEHWVPDDVAAGGPNCWLVVGFYDDVAVRTPEGWRLSSVKLTLTHQENEVLVAAVDVLSDRARLGDHGADGM